ncbi:MAG TPA: hypothetical protein VF666_03975 [Pyrinomonadaceae bacterium]|jgi:hypothetical protein
MENSRQYSVKSLWVTLWWSAFAIFRILQLSHGEVVFATSGLYNLLAAAMFLSSFPASLIYVIVNSDLCRSCYSMEMEPLFWMGMFAAGYIQWFYIVPCLLGKRKILALNLSTAETPVPQNSLTSSTLAPEKLPHLEAKIEPPLIIQTANTSQPAIQTTNAPAIQTSDIQQTVFHATDAYAPPVPRFDERGRSPVERAFADALST